MGVWAKMLLNESNVDGAGQTQDLNIPVDHIKYLDIMSHGLSTGTPTLANFLAGLSDIVVKLGGIRICNINQEDLFALNALWQAKAPLQFWLGQTADYYVMVGPQRLLLFVDKKGREMSLQVAYTDITAADNEELSVKYTYRDTPFRERRSYHLAYETFRNTGAASVRTNISRAGAYLIGLLIRNYRCAKGTDVDDDWSPEAAELDVIVDDRVVYSDNWLTRGDEQSVHAVIEEDTVHVDTILAHYQWISFEEEPWPADKLWTVTRNTQIFGENTAGDGTYRLIAVYIEP